MTNAPEIKNKKASFEYLFVDTFTAGIQLTGTEVKSIRLSQASLSEGYCVFENNELFVRGLHIAEYKYGTLNNHETKRDRKLLLNKRELTKLRKASEQKGFTIIPYRIFFSEKGLIKVNIALAKGKHTYDKREDLKKKDQDREMKRNLKF